MGDIATDIQNLAADLEAAKTAPAEPVAEVVTPGTAPVVTEPAREVTPAPAAPVVSAPPTVEYLLKRIENLEAWAQIPVQHIPVQA